MLARIGNRTDYDVPHCHLQSRPPGNAPLSSFEMAMMMLQFIQVENDLLLRANSVDAALYGYRLQLPKLWLLHP